VRLGAQPTSDVSVALAMPAGVCYTTASNSMVVASGAAVACAAAGGAGCGAGQDCRAQLATYSPAGPLVFTGANWNTAQAVYVTGTVDNVFEPEAPVVGSLALTPSSSDTRFDSAGVCIDAACSSAVANAGASIAITVADTTVPAVVVGAVSPSSISEASATPATYSVALGSIPKSDVLVSVITTSTGVSLPTNSLTFTRATWNVPQTVSVQPIDDFIVQGSRAAAVGHSISSTDAAYVALSPAAASVTITDNDVAGFAVSSWSPAIINQGGSGAVTYATLTLSAQPQSVVNVTFALAAGVPTRLTLSGAGVSGSSVLVQPSSWNVPVALTLTSESDGVANPNAAVAISATSTSGDAAFSALPAAAGSLTVLNQFAAGVVPAVAANPSLSAGASLTYTVTLQTNPLAAVTVSLAASVPAASAPFPAPFSISPSSLFFDVGLGQVPQQVTLQGVANQIAYPPGLLFGVVHTVANGSDAGYVASKPVSIAVGWTSANVASISLTPASTTLSVASPTGSLLLTLGSQPVTSVTVSMASQPGVLLANSSYTLTAANWQSGVTVPIALNDAVSHGTSVAVTASSGGAGSGDYSRWTVANAQAVVSLPLPSPTPSTSATPTPSPSATISVSPTVSQSASVSETPSITATPSPTTTRTPSVSPSPSTTASTTVSITATASGTLTVTPTPSLSLGSTPSSSGSPSGSPSLSPVLGTPSPSASQSAAAPTSPSKVVPTATASAVVVPANSPVVQLGIVFANADPASFQTAATRANIVASVASAAGVAASSVVITRIFDATNNQVLFSGSRRLAAASIEVTTRVTLPNVAAAQTFGNSVAAQPAVFSSGVLSNLRAADAATFGAVSATVPTASLQIPAAASASASPGASSSSSGSPMIGGPVGGAIGGIIVIVGGFLAYRRYASRRAGVEGAVKTPAAMQQARMIEAMASGDKSIEIRNPQMIVGRGAGRKARNNFGPTAKGQDRSAINAPNPIVFGKKKKTLQEEEEEEEARRQGSQV
jgi:hypothetical protein